MNAHPSFFRMASDEPYRILFPLGLLAGIFGVLLWPLYFTGFYPVYPGVLHARFMIEGFMGGYVLGFLGTAAPRLTGTPPFSSRELLSVLALYFGTLGAHLTGKHGAGDALFLLLLIVYLSFLIRRFFIAKGGGEFGKPPPGFVLVGFGFLCAVAGVAGLVITENGLGGPRWAILGGRLLNEIWILFLVLGVGSFLLPRLLKIAPALPGPNPAKTWRRRALWSIAAGAAIVALSLLEGVIDQPRWTGLARFMVAAGYLLVQVRLLKGATPKLTLPRCLYAAVGLILLGLLFPLGWPFQRVGGLHVIFIGGFALMTLTVATRVVLSHGGFGSLLARKLPFLGATALLFISAMVFRSGGDFTLLWRNGALNIGSLLWAAGAVLWGWKVLPKVRFVDPD
ncbi:MAG TPA: NnrS family protein [Chthoniobacteraceae bacterium]|nr:NnrS family protein [Chthoniobacteraceae bacterium]